MLGNTAEQTHTREGRDGKDHRSTFLLSWAQLTLQLLLLDTVLFPGCQLYFLIAWSFV
jgi:hypothetical protein